MPANSDTPIRIRQAKPDDSDALAKVWHESAANIDGAAFEMPTVENCYDDGGFSGGNMERLGL